MFPSITFTRLGWKITSFDIYIPIWFLSLLIPLFTTLYFWYQARAQNMVNLKAVRVHNASLRTSLPPSLVGVFVGGTSGIGLTTAREFARSTVSPHIYLVGRNQVEADKAIAEFKSLNADARTEFLKTDASLLKNVDDVCRQIKQKEDKVNLLFMSAGYLTTKGRDPTAENLDRKFSVHYYARMRFLHNLSPLLTAASTSKQLSRVISVLDPQLAFNMTPNFADLSLKDTFSLRNCGAHASTMNNFFLEEKAKAMPGTSFIHAFPSVVITGATRELGALWQVAIKAITPVLKGFTVPVQESGERHLYAATSPRFAPKADQNGGEKAMGSDRVNGSGAYLLSWNGDVFEQSKNMDKMRADGAGEKIARHTEEVFQKIESEGKY